MVQLRYDLDRLGWLEFEQLVQALLKERLGLGIEAWGNRGDFGRDAFFAGTLQYPNQDVEAGPFVFQAKFVEGANAAGARPSDALRNAVSAEATALRRRPAGPLKPRYYALFTNADATVADRAFIDEKISAASTAPISVHVHDGTDVCAWLDGTPSLLQTYPQLTGLTALFPRLEQIVGADLVSRSRAAIGEAEELARVFVTTSAFQSAQALLQRFGFVVVVGPPEVGKTAIGRMLALAALTRKWHAIECVGPVDFHRAYRSGDAQLFVADDFFGRSEYDAHMGSAWLRELPRVLSMVDDRHHLVFTTRRHLLAMLRDQLDLSGRARHFPEPSELTVDAGELTKIEKGRILYRHAKAKVSDASTRAFIRQIAVDIIDDAHFTPERIRRLVEDQSLAVELPSSDPYRFHARRLAADALARPTESMRTTLRVLPPAHRWLLYALVQAERIFRWSPVTDTTKSLRSEYERLCPKADLLPFDDVLSAMDHTFIIEDAGEVRWVHPSARDLVITELARNPKDRAYFVSCASGAGLALATSVRGDHGAGQFPFVQSDADWEALRRRIRQLAVASPLELVALFSNELHAQRFEETTLEHEKLRSTLIAAWPTIVTTLNERDAWTGEMLVHYARHNDGLAPVPLVLDGFARRAVDAVRDGLDKNRNTVFWQRAFDTECSWREFEAVHQLQGSLHAVSSHVHAIVDSLLTEIADELDSGHDDASMTLDDHAEYRSQCETLIVSVDTIERLLGTDLEHALRLRMAKLRTRLEDAERHHDDPEAWRLDSERSPRSIPPPADEVTIAALFSDL